MKPRQIRVVAKAGVLCPRPRHGKHGGIAEYVGRGVNHSAIASRDDDVNACYPPTVEAVPSDNLDIFRHVIGYVRSGDLLPADVATANYCGVKLAANTAKD